MCSNPLPILFTARTIVINKSMRSHTFSNTKVYLAKLKEFFRQPPLSLNRLLRQRPWLNLLPDHPVRLSGLISVHVLVDYAKSPTNNYLSMLFLLNQLSVSPLCIQARSIGVTTGMCRKTLCFLCQLAKIAKCFTVTS